MARRKDGTSMVKESVAVAFMDHGDDGGWVGHGADDNPEDV